VYIHATAGSRNLFGFFFIKISSDRRTGSILEEVAGIFMQGNRSTLGRTNTYNIDLNAESLGILGHLYGIPFVVLAVGYYHNSLVHITVRGK